MKKTLSSAFFLLAAFLLVTFPIQLFLAETSSAWGPVDYRIMSFVRSFTALTAKEVIKLEKR
jgi:hypothetical protein